MRLPAERTVLENCGLVFVQLNTCPFRFFSLGTAPITLISADIRCEHRYFKRQLVLRTFKIPREPVFPDVHSQGQCSLNCMTRGQVFSSYVFEITVSMIAMHRTTGAGLILRVDIVRNLLVAKRVQCGVG